VTFDPGSNFFSIYLFFFFFFFFLKKICRINRNTTVVPTLGKSTAPLEERVGWNDELREGLMHLQIGLNEGGEDLGMLPKVT
jgi:hypothetical protein